MFKIENLYGCRVLTFFAYLKCDKNIHKTVAVSLGYTQSENFKYTIAPIIINYDTIYT